MYREFERRYRLRGRVRFGRSTKRTSLDMGAIVVPDSYNEAHVERATDRVGAWIRRGVLGDDSL